MDVSGFFRDIPPENAPGEPGTLTDEADKLLRVFIAIKNPEIRARILALVETMAKDA